MLCRYDISPGTAGQHTIRRPNPTPGPAPQQFILLYPSIIPATKRFCPFLLAATTPFIAGPRDAGVIQPTPTSRPASIPKASLTRPQLILSSLSLTRPHSSSKTVPSSSSKLPVSTCRFVSNQNCTAPNIQQTAVALLLVATIGLHPTHRSVLGNLMRNRACRPRLRETDHRKPMRWPEVDLEIPKIRHHRQEPCCSCSCYGFLQLSVGRQEEK